MRNRIEPSRTVQTTYTGHSSNISLNLPNRLPKTGSRFMKGNPPESEMSEITSQPNLLPVVVSIQSQNSEKDGSERKND